MRSAAAVLPSEMTAGTPGTQLPWELTCRALGSGRRLVQAVLGTRGQQTPWEAACTEHALGKLAARTQPQLPQGLAPQPWTCSGSLTLLALPQRPLQALLEPRRLQPQLLLRLLLPKLVPRSALPWGGSSQARRALPAPPTIGSPLVEACQLPQLGLGAWQQTCWTWPSLHRESPHAMQALRRPWMTQLPTSKKCTSLSSNH